MNLLDWANSEVERVTINNPEDDCKLYSNACYASALKAYKSLLEDDHSGMSWGITRNILIRLMNHLPLSKIEDVDDVWVKIGEVYNQQIEYQCKRKSSLFKTIYSNGEIKYSDVDRFVCYDVNNPKWSSHFGLADRVAEECNEIGCIIMPYYPTEPIKVFKEDFLYNEKNGDFDTVGIIYALKPDGTRVDINRYFKESLNGWDEISKNEYESRKANKK